MGLWTPEMVDAANECDDFMVQSHDNTDAKTIRAKFLEIISRHITPLVARQRAAALREAAKKLNGPGTYPASPSEKVQAGMATRLRAMAQEEEDEAGGDG